MNAASPGPKGVVSRSRSKTAITGVCTGKGPQFQVEAAGTGASSQAPTSRQRHQLFPFDAAASVPALSCWQGLSLAGLQAAPSMTPASAEHTCVSGLIL